MGFFESDHSDPQATVRGPEQNSKGSLDDESEQWAGCEVYQLNIVIRVQISSLPSALGLGFSVTDLELRC